ncbi:glycosyltransferase family 2 protein [Aquimarina litoralis]|uniref:glycosyltransferase family 2 protein n=1 Tax=Aquimarina litoralis TaxID=584605 RepID=UPI001C56BF6C
MPLFSVVIPLYNKEKYIAATIRSVLDQKETDYEIIVVNDGSTDGSEDIVLEFKNPKIKYFKKNNTGVSDTRNFGISKTTGTYVAFLDADDYWFSNHLSEFKKSMSKHPDYLIFCNNYSVQLTSKKNIQTSFSYLPSNDQIVIIENYFRSSLNHSIVNSNSICIHASVLKKGYIFDTNINSGQDTDLWIRLGIDFPFVFNKTVTSIYYQFVANSLSKTNVLDSRKKVIDKFPEQEKNTPYLKQFADLNRFSIAIRYKMNGKKVAFRELADQIDMNNLNPKQQFLLKCPQKVLQTIFVLKNNLYKYNIRLSAFE